MPPTKLARTAGAVPQRIALDAKRIGVLQRFHRQVGRTRRVHAHAVHAVAVRACAHAAGDRLVVHEIHAGARIGPGEDVEDGADRCPPAPSRAAPARARRRSRRPARWRRSNGSRSPPAAPGRRRCRGRRDVERAVVAGVRRHVRIEHALRYGINRCEQRAIRNVARALELRDPSPRNRNRSRLLLTVSASRDLAQVSPSELPSRKSSAM